MQRGGGEADDRDLAERSVAFGSAGYHDLGLEKIELHWIVAAQLASALRSNTHDVVGWAHSSAR